MRVILTICVAFLMMPFRLFAQHVFEEGVVVLQPGIGYGLIGTEGTVEIPPVSLNLEFAGSPEWSFGGYVGYASSKETYISSSNTGGWWTLPDYGFRATYLIFGGRLNYHMNTESEKVDTYAGVMLGYNAVSVSEWGGNVNRPASLNFSGVLYGGQIGVRYYFSPALGVFTEAGYGIGFVTAGLSLKLGGSGRSDMTEASEARRAEQDIWRKWDERVGRVDTEEPVEVSDELADSGQDIARRWNERLSRSEVQESDETGSGGRESWSTWNQSANRTAREEAEEEIVLRVKILYIKNGFCIINLGGHKGLRPGMDVNVYPAFDHTAFENQGFPARITEMRVRHAVIKILNASLAAMLATGDELVLKVSPARADNY